MKYRLFQIIFEPQDIAQVIGAVLPYLESEPVLIEVYGIGQEYGSQY